MKNLALKLKSPYVFKFVPKLAWNSFILTNDSIFKGYGNDVRDGFIHLSTHEQLYSSFTSRYTEKQKHYFKLLAVDLDEVDDVRWEKAKNGLVCPRVYSGLLVKRDILWVINMDDYMFDCDGI